MKTLEENLGVKKNENGQIICRLPKLMNPSKEVFERLGFVFEDYGDKVFVKAQLPQGWCVKSEQNMWGYIYDANNCKRVCVVCKPYSGKLTGSMGLTRRFSIVKENIKVGTSGVAISVAVHDEMQKIHYSAGQCADTYVSDFEKFNQVALTWLNENYPGWKNPKNYWD